MTTSPSRCRSTKKVTSGHRTSTRSSTLLKRVGTAYEDNQTWYNTTFTETKDQDKFKEVFKAAGKFMLAKDTKYTTYQNAVRQGSTQKGDFLYMMADTEIFVFFITPNGNLDPAFVANLNASDIEKDTLTRLMVYDNNIMTVWKKKVTVFQFQNLAIQQKQTFGPFKDVEDIAISRINGMRIFKVKGTKGKFKVFTTLPSSDWSPYIEGVNKKAMLDDKEYPRIDLIDGQYGNIVIMAYTGKHYKYFVVGNRNLGHWYQLFLFHLH